VVEVTPHRFGLVAGLFVFVSFMGISHWLQVRPGWPMATRTDVFFQSDAGGLIHDAILNHNERARGTHPLLYPCWTRPVHALTHLLEGRVPPETTATVASRVLVAGASGLGAGVLFGTLAGLGLARGRLVLALLLFAMANGHTLAAIPDHFGISLGLFCTATALLLRPMRPRSRWLALAGLGLLLFGITVTNVLYVMLFACAAIIRELQGLRRYAFLAAGLLALGLAWAGLHYTLKARPEIQKRVDERISLYLNDRIRLQPVAALEYTVRGLTDCMVAPTPHLTTDNLDQRLMLSYEREDAVRDFWPHDLWQTAAALAWFGLVVYGTIVLARTQRLLAVCLWLWVLGNGAFHNYWGDEYFLYSPHYAFALWLFAAYALQALPRGWATLSAVLILSGALHTLWQYGDLLAGIMQ
jgi:hypothetical protein